MSQTGVNTGFAKCFILFMACVILIQGVVYVGLSIWGFTLDSCSDTPTDISAEPFHFAMDLIYFADEKCGYPNVSIGDDNALVESIQLDWAKSEEITNRTNIFLITYVTVSALWVVTSMLVIASICGPVTKLVVGLSYWPWFLVVIAGSVLDAVATGYHVHDILHTTSADETFAYLGIRETGDIVYTFLSTFSAYFVMPAVVMTCVSSRVVLVWLLNIFGTSFCLSLSTVLQKASKASPAERNGHQATAASRSPQPQTPQPQPQPQSQSQQQLQPQQQWHQQQQQQPQPQQPQVFSPQQEQNFEQYQRQATPVRVLPPTAMNNRRAQQEYTPTPTPEPTPAVMPTAPSPDRSTHDASQPKLLISDAATYRNADTHPDHIDYPLPQSPTGDRPPLTQMSVVSPLNNRYSSSDMALQQQQSAGPSNRISEELRSQLPWSYTSSAQPIARKPQVQIYPEIPQPDYGGN